MNERRLPKSHLRAPAKTAAELRPKLASAAETSLVTDIRYLPDSGIHLSHKAELASAYIAAGARLLARLLGLGEAVYTVRRIADRLQSDGPDQSVKNLMQP